MESLKPNTQWGQWVDNNWEQDGYYKPLSSAAMFTSDNKQLQFDPSTGGYATPTGGYATPQTWWEQNSQGLGDVPEGWRVISDPAGKDLTAYNPFDFSQYQAIGSAPEIPGTRIGGLPITPSFDLGLPSNVSLSQQYTDSMPGFGTSNMMESPQVPDPTGEFRSGMGGSDFLFSNEKFGTGYRSGSDSPWWVSSILHPILKTVPSMVAGMVPKYGPFLAAALNMALSGAEAGHKAWDLDRLAMSGLQGYGAGTLGAGLSSAMQFGAGGAAGAATSATGGGIESGYGFEGQIGAPSPSVSGLLGSYAAKKALPRVMNEVVGSKGGGTVAAALQQALSAPRQAPQEAQAQGELPSITASQLPSMTKNLSGVGAETGSMSNYRMLNKLRRA